MDIQSTMRAHIESQSRKSKLRNFEESVNEPSFHKLNQKEKRELAAFLIAGPDGDDMIVNHNGPQLTQLI